jgi:phosphorylcholine metabolism protein LicD
MKLKLTDEMKVVIGIIIFIGICIITYYTYSSRNFKNDKEEYSYELLTNTKMLLDDNNIEFFLDYGTLLGAYRDNQFIPHDTDIDISIYDYENIHTITNNEELKKYNLQTVRKEKELYSLKLINFKGELLHNKLQYDNEIYIDIYKVYFQPTTTLYKFYNTKFNIPTNTDKYLEHMYGDTWKTPIKGKHGQWPSSSKTIKNTEWFKDNVIEHKL